MEYQRGNTPVYPNSCKGQVKFYGFFVLSGTLQIPVPVPEQGSSCRAGTESWFPGVRVSASVTSGSEDFSSDTQVNKDSKKDIYSFLLFHTPKITTTRPSERRTVVPSRARMPPRKPPVFPAACEGCADEARTAQVLNWFDVAVRVVVPVSTLVWSRIHLPSGLS